MKKRSGLIIVACLIAGAWIVGLAGQSEHDEKSKDGEAQMGPGMMQKMMGQKGEMETPECCKKMLEGMGPGMMRGMTPEAMERMQLLMRTPIFLDAPCPIFAQAERLGLSEDQKKKLREIENEARAKARAILTKEQQMKLGNVPDKPMTMMETCPMMKMMQGKEESAPSSPESQKAK